MVTKTVEELVRDQLWEELRLWNQPAGGTEEQFQPHLSSLLKKEGLDRDTEAFEVEDAESTPDPLSQTLEKLSAPQNTTLAI